MKEKILAFLKTKIGSHAGGIQESYLIGIAETYSKTITEESQIAAVLTDGILDVLKATYTSIQSEIDRKADAKTKAELKSFQEKHGLDENGLPINKDKDKDKDKGKDKDKDQDIARIITDALKPLQDKIASMEGSKTLGVRKQALEAKLKDVPDQYKAKVLKDFERMSFEKDEDFDKYLTETETDVAAFNQELADKRLGEHGKPNVFGTKDKDGVSKATQDFITSQAKSQDNLGGKELKTH